MKSAIRVALLTSVFATGYWLGQSNLDSSQELKAAQGKSDNGFSEDTSRKLSAAHDAVAAAQENLLNEGLYNPAIDGTNAYAVMIGGVDAVQDLERGLGVDPETFVGLHSGLATPEIASKLREDENGRLVYNDVPVRLYSPSRLKQLNAQREKIASANK